MPQIDSKQREKWPAPHDPPPAEYVQEEVEKARAESQGDPLKAKARAVLALLRAEYGEPEWPILDPLGMLVEILLSHRTADPATWRAYNSLRTRFSSWEEVCAAQVASAPA